MKNTLFTCLCVCLLGCLSGSQANAQTTSGDGPALQIYEWRIYTLAPDADAALLDEFFREQLIPAYGRHGVEVGVFMPADTYREFPAGARCLFMAWPDLETYRKVNRAVREDAAFLTGAAAYFDASAPDPVYRNFETYLFEALDSRPVLARPAEGRGLFEFRVYRSPNIEANERKIHMFENGEIDVFEATGINAVFYGRTLAGSKMPSLAYLTWYKDAASRDEAWEKFGVHPQWERLRNMPKYANTATDNTIRLFTPLPYSQY